MQKSNSQNVLVKECIFEAFMILLKNKNFYDISITEIVDKAGVSRMAYYRNYSSKEGIIDHHLNELFLYYMDELKSGNQLETYQLSKTFFAFFRHHKVLLDNLIQSNVTYLLLDHLEKNIHPLIQALPLEPNQKSIKTKYIANFIAGGLFQVLIEWCKNSMVESDEQMAQLITAFILNEIN